MAAPHVQNLDYSVYAINVRDFPGFYRGANICNVMNDLKRNCIENEKEAPFAEFLSGKATCVLCMTSVSQLSEYIKCLKCNAIYDLTCLNEHFRGLEGLQDELKEIKNEKKERKRAWERALSKIKQYTNECCEELQECYGKLHSILEAQEKAKGKKRKRSENSDKLELKLLARACLLHYEIWHLFPSIVDPMQRRGMVLPCNRKSVQMLVKENVQSLENHVRSVYSQLQDDHLVHDAVEHECSKQTWVGDRKCRQYGWKTSLDITGADDEEPAVISTHSPVKWKWKQLRNTVHNSTMRILMQFLETAEMNHNPDDRDDYAQGDYIKQAMHDLHGKREHIKASHHYDNKTKCPSCKCDWLHYENAPYKGSILPTALPETKEEKHVKDEAKKATDPETRSALEKGAEKLAWRRYWQSFDEWNIPVNHKPGDIDKKQTTRPSNPARLEASRQRIQAAVQRVSIKFTPPEQAAFKISKLRLPERRQPLNIDGFRQFMLQRFHHAVDFVPFKSVLIDPQFDVVLQYDHRNRHGEKGKVIFYIAGVLELHRFAGDSHYTELCDALKEAFQEYVSVECDNYHRFYFENEDRWYKDEDFPDEHTSPPAQPSASKVAARSSAKNMNFGSGQNTYKKQKTSMERKALKHIECAYKALKSTSYE